MADIFSRQEHDPWEQQRQMLEEFVAQRYDLGMPNRLRELAGAIQAALDRAEQTTRLVQVSADRLQLDLGVFQLRYQDGQPEILVRDQPWHKMLPGMLVQHLELHLDAQDTIPRLILTIYPLPSALEPPVASDVVIDPSQEELAS